MDVMRNLLKKIKKGSFVKNVAILMSGTAISQGIIIAATPILTRLYDPSDFGILALYTSIISILTVIVAWRYELAIVLPESDKEASDILKLSISIVFIMSIISFVFMSLFYERVTSMLGVQSIDYFIYVIPFSLLFLGLYECLKFWSTRQKHYKRLSISNVFKAKASVGTQVGSGVIGIGSVGLVAGQIIGQMMASLVLLFQVVRDDRKLLFRRSEFKEIQALAKRYSDLPLYSAPQATINSVSKNVPAILLTAYFGTAVVGLYALALKLLQLPITLLGNTFMQVFFQKATEVVNKKGDVYKLYKKAVSKLFIIGILPTIFIILFAPLLFKVVLGEEWLEAGIYAQWLILWLFMFFVNRPSIIMIRIINWHKFHLVSEIIFMVMKIMAIIIGATYYDQLVSIILYSLVSTAHYLILLVAVHIKVKKRFGTNSTFIAL